MKKYGRKFKIKGRIVSVAVIVLLVVSLSPNISATSAEYTMTHERNEHPILTKTSGGLIDNVKTECHGNYLTSIPFIILGVRTSYIRIEHSIYHDFPVYIDMNVILETRDGRILTEFAIHPPIPFEGMVVYFFFDRYDWKYFGYQFGFFDITIVTTIRNDGSHETLVFHGFNYFFGAVILNTEGEKIE